MKLSDVFSQLSYGELSQITLGATANQGVIDASNYGAVLAHINLGLTTLYSRFPLKEGRVTFALKPGQYSYNINSDGNVRFVQGPADDEFVDDILKIEKVLTDPGWELELNNAANGYSCFTPSSTVLSVPVAIVDQILDLPKEYLTSNLTAVYRANHPILAMSRGAFNPAIVPVELPQSHLGALLLFVASRVYNPIGMDHQFHSGNNYYAKFEAACKDLEFKNLSVDQGSQSSRLRVNGWV